MRLTVSAICGTDLHFVGGTQTQLVQAGEIDPERVLTKREPLMSALDADKAFDQRKPGWIKVELETNGHGETPKPPFEVEDVAR